ncbi:CAF17-like 4Fe-4S cluster assembly/insertion protein YgfZ [Parasphingopyxis marina]|uniref:Folate-binding protein YgfZ n=1 Tax=Parasphingopyxis marina TaxID=2761622 RepID=A0A842HVT5_9SPHN|nr:folate-binding protein YgfZ [Parasphingopyxis marina]MBC2776603.1 folate-binding protein YgfZ [Parasphingopyxis marina]
MADTHLSDRALIRISGEDVSGFLQGLVSQDVAKVVPGAPQWAGLLTAQGKALFDFLLWADGEDILVDCEAAAAEDLSKRLSVYRLRRPIAIEREDALAVHWSPDESDRPTDPRLAALGHRWLAPAETAGDASAAWRVHRLAFGVTEGIAELGSDKTLWLECNAGELNGVDFKKGCYVGQENTARMHYRNKVNRRLVVVPLDQADEKRQRIAYPDMGLSVEHRRVEDLSGIALPDWLAAATA